MWFVKSNINWGVLSFQPPSGTSLSCIDTTVGNGVMTTPLYLADTGGEDEGGCCFELRKRVTLLKASGFFANPWLQPQSNIKPAFFLPLPQQMILRAFFVDPITRAETHDDFPFKYFAIWYFKTTHPYRAPIPKPSVSNFDELSYWNFSDYCESQVPSHH